MNITMVSLVCHFLLCLTLLAIASSSSSCLEHTVDWISMTSLIIWVTDFHPLPETTFPEKALAKKMKGGKITLCHVVAVLCSFSSRCRWWYKHLTQQLDYDYILVYTASYRDREEKEWEKEWEEEGGIEKRESSSAVIQTLPVLFSFFFSLSFYLPFVYIPFEWVSQLHCNTNEIQTALSLSSLGYSSWLTMWSSFSNRYSCYSSSSSSRKNFHYDCRGHYALVLLFVREVIATAVSHGEEYVSLYQMQEENVVEIGK